MNIDIRDTTSVADRLRYSAQGFKEWRVQKLKDGEYIIFFSHWEGGAARQWFEDQQRRYPDSVRGYELALVDVKSERDALCNEAADELDRLRARVAELEQDRMHAGVDICEVAAAVEIVRAQEVVKAVEALADGYHDGPFRHGFETACEEIAHRLRPCEHCDAALSKDAAP